MSKTVAVALAAMAAFDFLYMNGQYTHAVMAVLSHWMPIATTSFHVIMIAFVAVFLFLAVDWLEPRRRLGRILKIVIIAAALVAIVIQLLP
jgi:uncharacterized membrane protein